MPNYQKLLLFTFIFTDVCFGSPQLNEEAERIMEVILVDGTQMHSSLVIYPFETSWVFPLGELAESLGIKINVSSALEGAEGFILSEDRPFRLNIKECSFKIGSKTESYQCPAAFTFRSDIFVTKELLVTILPIDLEYEFNKSRIVIYPKEKLPLQLSKERKQQAQSFSAILSDYDPGYPRLKPKHAVLDGFFLDTELGYNKQLQSGENTFTLSNSLSGEVLGFETRVLESYTKNEFTPLRVTFSKHSVDGRLFSPLKIRSVELLDVNLPSIPLITLGASGRGGTLSNFPLNAPTRFGQHDVSGEIRQGWEVVLYQNDILVGRQTSNPEGRFNFTSVPLIYGKNRFHLVFYGPFGEKKEEYRVVEVSQSFTPPGNAYFRVGAVQSYDSITKAIGQIDYGIAQTMTITSGFYTKSNQNQIFGYGGAHLSLFGWYTSIICSITNQKGSACEGRFQGEPLHSVALSVTHTRLSSFRSEAFNTDDGSLLTDRTKATLSLPFAFTGSHLELEGVHDQYESLGKKLELKKRLSFNIGAVNALNELSWADTVPEEVSGEFDITYIPSTSLFRIGTGYTRKGIASLEGEIHFRPVASLSAQIASRFELETKRTESMLNVSKAFDGFSAGGTVSLSDLTFASLGVLVSFGLGREPYQNKIYSSAVPLSSMGALSVRVFRDKNRNGIKEEDEVTLKGVGVSLGGSSSEKTTNELGIATFEALEPHRPVDITMSLATLEDPALRPGRKGVRIYPRPGKTIQLDFPILFFGELEGTVKYSKDMKTTNQVYAPVDIFTSDLKFLKRVKTDFEGNYLIDELIPGEYYLRIDPTFLKNSNLISVPEAWGALIREEEPYVTGAEFELRPNTSGLETNKSP